MEEVAALKAKEAATLNNLEQVAEERAALGQQLSRLKSELQVERDKATATEEEMLEELLQVLDDADADDEVRAIIFTGAGRGFCSGMDLKAFARGEDIGPLSTLAYHASAASLLGHSMIAIPEGISPSPSSRSISKVLARYRPPCRPTRAGTSAS